MKQRRSEKKAPVPPAGAFSYPFPSYLTLHLCRIFAPMQTIGVQQMLAHIERVNEDGTPHEFHLVFVRGSGKLEGSLKEVAKVRKLGHASGHNHKERGTIPLYDVVGQRNLTPFIDNILFYNGMRVLM